VSAVRPLEIVLVLAEVAICAGAALRRVRSVRGIGAAPFAPAVAAIAQAVIEGPRWQLVPAYGLAVVLAPAALATLTTSRAGRAGRVLRSRTVVALAAVLGTLALVASIGLPTVLPVFRLPAPDGLYPIGTLTYHWTDESRQEIFSPDPSARRELMVQLWYPAAASADPPAPYVQGAGALSAAVSRLAHLPPYALDHLKYVTTAAVPSAPVSPRLSRYPVLIFLAGLDGFRQMNTVQVQSLVSHGYLVAALDQPYTAGSVTFPDGRQVTGWTKDRVEPFTQQSLNPSATPPSLNGRPQPGGIMPYLARDVGLALDRLAALDAADPPGILAGRLDLAHAGVFGISLGAIAAGQACHDEPRLRACLMMDAAMPAAVVTDGLAQPAMWLTRDAATMRLERQRAGGWTEADISQTLGTMRATFEESRPGTGYYVEIPGMFHLNFTDTPHYTPLATRLGFAGPIDAGRGDAVVDAYTLAFFDRYLAGLPEPLLAGPSRDYPEATLRRR
jgi:predicted dienelactone hydrolase